MRYRINSLMAIVGLLTILILAVSSASYFSTAAPAAQSDPIPLPQPGNADSAAVNTDFADYHIVYLVQTGAETDTLSEAVINATQAQPVHQWSDVSALDDTQPIQVLIVHRNAFDLADPVWIKKAYTEGMVLVTINMTHVENVTLRGAAPCRIKEAEAKSNPFTSDFYYVSVFGVFTDNPTDQAIVEAAHANCSTDYQGYIGTIYTRGYASQGELTNATGIAAFAEDIQGAVFRVEDTRTNFASRDLPPTSIPEGK